MNLTNDEHNQLAKLKVVLDAARCQTEGKIIIDTKQQDPFARCVIDGALLDKILKEAGE
jgi:hypothetical protein